MQRKLKTEILAFRAEPWMYDEIAEIAEREDRSKGAVVRRLIEEALESRRTMWALPDALGEPVAKTKQEA